MTDLPAWRADATPYTLATWAVVLHRAGVTPDDEVVRDACERLAAATEPAEAARIGEALVERIRSLAPDEEPDAIASFGRALFGERADGGFLDAERDGRLRSIRRHQFESALPWLARCWERFSDGTVHPLWLIVEGVTDRVQAMDPNPWDDVDEERFLPLADFLVRWELSGCAHLRVRR